MEDYLKEDYGVIEDVKYLKSVDDISDYFIDDAYIYFDCGHGYHQDKALVLVKISEKFYEVTMEAEIESQKQNRGGRLYWVEDITSLIFREIPKPPKKKRFITEYSLLLTEDEVKVCDKFLSKFKHYYENEAGGDPLK